MVPHRKAHAVRRLVLTIIATAICFALWSNDRHNSKQKELETSLKRRRLLQDAGLKGPTTSSDDNEDTEDSTPEFDEYFDSLHSKRPPKPRHPSSTSSTVVQEITISPKEEEEEEEGERPSKGLDSKPSQIEPTRPRGHNRKPKLPTLKAPAEETGKPADGGSQKTNSMESHHVKLPPGEEEIGNHQAVPATTARPRKDPTSPNVWHKLDQIPPKLVPTSTGKSNVSEPTATPIEEECTPPAYHEFPPDLFTHKQRAHGAVIIHIAVIIYMFYAVAVVCDDYFVASLEECCSRLNLSEDVAGATFMAAGSSAPELFTAILGVLVAKGDVGTGTIVGSAVFNVLFVIGICGYFSGRIVELTWWPLFRDSIFYSATVILLIAIIFDSEVTWYESVIMMVIYGLYILLMKFNSDVHFWISRRLGIEDDTTQNIGILAQGDKKNYSSYVPFNNEIDECASMPVTAHFSIKKMMPADESIRLSPRLLSIHEAALVFLMKRQFRPKTRFRAAAIRIIIEQRRMRKETNKMQGQVSIESQDSIHKAKPKAFSSSAGGFALYHPRLPKGQVEEVLPPHLLHLHRVDGHLLLRHGVDGNFVGYTLGIPDSIMGITFLAAGTSVPDAFASLIVARQGLGDMAVSNSLGSNIFDILIGLAFPWFMQTALIEPGSIAVINSRGMVYSVILLFMTIIITKFVFT
ncbi:Sodium/potassium/calcium exchanger 3 like protein [Argiope bruennichi]|uniref:Sodium/potassium/calcium exchanger 3 like protein n=1 Tax=Argiope bruennichi TaxID=94029 RepID=A0A8T0EVC9_ARGBR|nr:Sodium/potassium/calcium exchanger 3 like protein [Argiope bruennichi]